MGRYGGISVKNEFIIFLMVIAVIQGVYGIQVTASGGGNGESGSVSMNFDTLKDSAVSSQIAINDADLTPLTTISGPVAKFEQTHAVKDASGKRASVYVKVLNAPSGLTYTSKVLPNEGTVATQTQVSAEQWLTVPKADSLLCTATASYGAFSAGVGLTETKGTATGDYVSLMGYDGKATATATLVSASQTATSGSANSIAINGSSKDSSGSYGVNTRLNGKFMGLSDTSSAGTTTQVVQNEHLTGTFTSTATFTPPIGTAMTKTRTSNYGTEYDLYMKAAKGSSPIGIVGYYVNPTMKIQGAVNSAQSSDTVNVAAGTYKENVRIDKSLTVKGAGSAETIVDGNKAGTVFTIGTVHSNVNVALSGMKITGGAAQNGGGIFNMGTATITNSEISGNTAVHDGGGCHNYNIGIATISGSTISGNSAGNGGGGIINYGTGAKLAVSGSTISGNTAVTDGSGIFNTGTATVTNSEISGNTAGHDGGGFHNYDTGTATISSSTISGNSAGMGGGGIINYGTGTKLAVSSSTISGNSAKDNGGGIYTAMDVGDQGSNYGTATFTDSTISGNTAGQDGAGIFNSMIATVTNCIISGNKAVMGGGGFHNYNIGIATISGSTISGNSAGMGGGGVFNYDTGAKLTVSSSTISGNTAGHDGGGLFNTGTATVTNSEISRNTAGHDGGGFHNYDTGTATISSSTISGNTAGNGGGGVLNYGTGTLFVSGTSQIINNQATTGYGGGIYSTDGSVSFDGTKVAVKSNKAHQPLTLPAGTPWYRQYGAYLACALTTTNGFNPATQVTGNTHI